MKWTDEIDKKLFFHIFVKSDVKVDHVAAANFLSTETGEAVTPKAIKEHLYMLKKKSERVYDFLSTYHWFTCLTAVRKVEQLLPNYVAMLTRSLCYRGNTVTGSGPTIGANSPKATKSSSSKGKNGPTPPTSNDEEDEENGDAKPPTSKKRKTTTVGTNGAKAKAGAKTANRVKKASNGSGSDTEMKLEGEGLAGDSGVNGVKTEEEMA